MTRVMSEVAIWSIDAPTEEQRKDGEKVLSELVHDYLPWAPAAVNILRTGEKPREDAAKRVEAAIAREKTKTVAAEFHHSGVTVATADTGLATTVRAQRSLDGIA